jgi:trimethylamine--corrinoid protein Co-methyltransferase
MARANRRRSRKLPAAPAVAIRQLDRQQLRNRFTPLEALDEEQLEFIHDISLRILEEEGVEVMGDQALDLFRQAGAAVDDNGVVRMDRALLLETVAQAPESFDVVPRNPEQTLSVGANVINFGLVSGTPNVHDNINGRRAGNYEDYKKLISFGQYFNVLTFFGNQATAPTDMPANTRHLDTTHINLTLSDKPFFATGIGGGRARDAIEMSAIARGLSMEDMRANPSVMTNINVNSPRKLDADVDVRATGDGDTLHPDGRDDTDDHGRRTGAAKRRSVTGYIPVAIDQPGDAGGLRWVYLQCRYALGIAGLRHTRKRAGQHRRGPARAPL